MLTSGTDARALAVPNYIWPHHAYLKVCTTTSYAARMEKKSKSATECAGLVR
jgi:hypothetical protein